MSNSGRCDADLLFGKRAGLFRGAFPAFLETNRGFSPAFSTLLCVHMHVYVRVRFLFVLLAGEITGWLANDRHPSQR